MEEADILECYHLADDERLVWHKVFGWCIVWNGMRLDISLGEAIKIRLDYGLLGTPEIEDF